MCPVFLPEWNSGKKKRRKNRQAPGGGGGGYTNDDSISAAAARGWLYFSKHSDFEFTCQNPDCDSHSYRDDVVEDVRICKQCHMVGEHLNFCYDLSEYSVRRVALVYGTHSEYRRVYHFSERLAQWLRIGPPAPDWLVDGIDALVGPSRSAQEIVDHLDAFVVKECCRSIGEYAMKYAERWIDIRIKIIERRGIKYEMKYPTEGYITEMKEKFAQASHVFDKLYYKPGNRRTAKDNVYNNKDYRLSRHNFVNYNYCLHQLLWSFGLHQTCEAHFYFPLLRTERVLMDLQKRWVEICDELGWKYASLGDLGYEKKR